MRRLLIATFALGSLVASTGCGSSDDGGDPGPTDPESDPTPMEPGPSDPEPASDACGLATDYIGDEYCILPPPVDEGFQIHYGPGLADYDNPDAVAPFMLEPGAEITVDEPMTSGNPTDVFYYLRQYRMRPGSHHLIVLDESNGAVARRLGGTQNVSKDNPSGEIAPENVGMGMPLSASAPLILNVHHFNGTEQPILREAWVNFWYVDPADVTQEATEMFLWAQGPSVQPGAQVLVSGSYAIGEAGRITTIYGHRHSNSTEFRAYHVRGAERTLIYEDFDWLEPATFEFNSLTENPPPGSGSLLAGAHSGILELLPGDLLEWECDVVNEHDFVVTFGQDEAVTSEMCILVGDGVGTTLMNFSF